MKNKIIQNKFVLFFSILLTINISCLQEEMLIAEASFTFQESTISNGKLLRFTNTSFGGETFLWSFENGLPATSNSFNPGEVIFNTAGTHKIKLKVSNKDGSVSETEKTITVETASIVDFNYEVLINNYAPVEVKLINTSQNVAQYNWEFSSGLPSTSNVRDPQNVIFNQVGQQSISLSNGSGLQKTINFEVLPALNLDFSWSVLPIDSDYNAPMKIKISNSTISATSYTWEVVGATPSISSETNPEFLFNIAGNYQIKLTATNGKQTQSLIKNITVLPYTNLSTQSNIKLGINTAHNTLGSYYSTKLKSVINANSVSATNENLIDIVYYGLSNTFDYNIFVSPSQASTFGFATIANATNTQFTNKQEACACTNITVADFDNLTNDTFLQAYSIITQNSNFNSSVLPRIVPFITQDNRKGLIKIKEYHADGLNSYIIIDIKVQKQ